MLWHVRKVVLLFSVLQFGYYFDLGRLRVTYIFFFDVWQAQLWTSDMAHANGIIVLWRKHAVLRRVKFRSSQQLLLATRHLLFANCEALPRAYIANWRLFNSRSFEKIHLRWTMVSLSWRQIYCIQTVEDLTVCDRIFAVRTQIEFLGVAWLDIQSEVWRHGVFLFIDVVYAAAHGSWITRAYWDID